MLSTHNPGRGHSVVWGGYGWGNTGDDLTLAVALKDLREAHGDNLVVLTPDPTHTARMLPSRQLVACEVNDGPATTGRWFSKWMARRSGVGTRPWAHRLVLSLLQHTRNGAAPGWTRALTSASRLHLVGGGYLTDLFDIEYYLQPIRLARRLGLPVTTSPLGLGPFTNPSAAQALAETLGGLKVLVRDESSYAFAQAHGLSAEMRPDDGFRLPEIMSLQHPRHRPSSAAQRVGVCVFSQYGKQWSSQDEGWWVDCLRTLTQTLPECRIEGFCFHTYREMDFKTTRRLFTLAGLNPDAVQPPEPDFRRAISNLGDFDAILSTRFHAVVTAATMGVPCLAVALNDYYEIKMHAALRHARQQISVINPGQCEPAAVTAQLKGLLDTARQHHQAAATLVHVRRLNLEQER